MRPITVLDLRDTDEIGGPGKTILETFRATDAARFRMHVAVFQTRGERADTPFVAAARQLGLPLHVIRGFNQYDPRLVSRTAALVRSLGIDIVHTHEVKSDVIAYLAKRLHDVPIVTTLHGWIGNSPKQRAFIALDKQVVRGFDKVIAVSQLIRDQAIQAGARPDRVQLLHNAIVLDRYRRDDRRGALAALAGRPVPGPVLASIGRLSAEKGHLDFIEALAIVARDGRRVSAVLAGDGPERGNIEARIAALGLADRVYLTGYIERPQDILNETDLMVLPSHTEGLPNAALEALAMGVPVLATNVGGTPEVVIDGETGRLVPAHQPAALAEAIGSFLKAPAAWQHMATRGRAHVEQHFDFRARTRRLESMYTELARTTSR